MLRKDVSEELKWKLSDIFETDEKWEDDLKKIEEVLPRTEEMKKNIAPDAKTLLNNLKDIDEISLVLERLYVYARMKRDEDNANSKYQAMTGKATTASVQLSSALSFLNPELLKLDEKTIEGYIKEDCLEDYNFFLSELLRQKKHILSEKEEKLLAMASDFSGGAREIFTMLNNVDIKLGEVDGELLTHGKYIVNMQSEDRDKRKRTYDTFYGAFKGNINTIATAYSTSVKKDIFYSRARNYGSAIQRALFSDDVPVGLYENLIKMVHENISIMHRYIDLKKRALNIDSIYMYDIYAPLVEEQNRQYDYNEAVEINLKGLMPLGEQYMEVLKSAFGAGWVDVCETEGKTSGAYSWGAYGTHPYVLLNHRGDLDSVFTIAHEMGHAMHTYYSNNSQPYSKAGYSIFVAEVASTVNEILLTHYLLKNTEGEERKYILNHYIDQFRTTVVRQTMFAEFEKKTHELAEKGEPLVWENLCDLYGELNSLYHGNVMEADENITYEWARIPHFYNAFYVYKYATGFSCAVQIANDILAGRGVDNYIKFLSSGGNDHPLNQLKIAGVDLESGVPVAKCMEEFDRALSEFEKEF